MTEATATINSELLNADFKSVFDNYFGAKSLVFSEEKYKQGAPIEDILQIQIIKKPESVQAQADFMTGGDFGTAFTQSPESIVDVYAEEKDDQGTPLEKSTRKILHFLSQEGVNKELRKAALETVVTNIGRLTIPESSDELLGTRGHQVTELIANRVEILFRAYGLVSDPETKNLIRGHIDTQMPNMETYLHARNNVARNIIVADAVILSDNLYEYLKDSPATESGLIIYREWLNYVLNYDMIRSHYLSDCVNFLRYNRNPSFRNANESLLDKFLEDCGLEGIEDLDAMCEIWKKSNTAVNRGIDYKMGSCLRIMKGANKEYPHSVRVNRSRCGIMHFDRYSASDMAAQAKGIEENPGEFFSQLESVFVGPVDDHNGAWNQNGEPGDMRAEANYILNAGAVKNFFGGNLDALNRLFLEVNSGNKVLEFLREINMAKANTSGANSLKFIELGAHSDANGMYFNGRRDPLTKKHLDDLTRKDVMEMTSTWDENLLMYLRACSAGGKGPNSIAAKIAQKFQCFVYGARYIKEGMSIKDDEEASPDDITEDFLALPRLTYGKITLPEYLIEKTALFKAIKKIFPGLIKVKPTEDMTIFYGDGII